MRYAIERNFAYMEVSAKTGHGVKEAFDRLVGEVYRLHQLEGCDDDAAVKMTNTLYSTGVAGNLHKNSVLL